MRTHLKQSELQTFFNLSHDLLCIADVSGFFHCVNPAFTRVLGYEEDELLDRPFIEFVHPDDQLATLAALEELSNGKTVVAFENRYRSKNWEYKTLQWNATPDRQSDFIAATARDVSVERALQTEAKNSQKLKALGTVAATIAHDMNNLLAPIVTMSELLISRHGANHDRVEGEANLILASANRAGDLVNQILFFAEETPPRFGEVSIEQAVHEVVQGLESDIPVKLNIGNSKNGLN